METAQVKSIGHATANLKNLLTDLVNDLDAKNKKT
jgi:hypothetical protein